VLRNERGIEMRIVKRQVGACPELLDEGWPNAGVGNDDVLQTWHVERLVAWRPIDEHVDGTHVGGNGIGIGVDHDRFGIHERREGVTCHTCTPPHA